MLIPLIIIIAYPVYSGNSTTLLSSVLCAVRRPRLTVN